MSDREHYENTRSRFAAILNANVGRGKRFTLDALSEATGIPVPSLYDMARGRYVPKLHEGLLIATRLGPAAVTALLEQFGMEARAVEPGDPCPHQANARVAALLHRIAERLADGKIDHREDPEHQADCLDAVEFLVGHVNARRAGK